MNPPPPHMTHSVCPSVNNLTFSFSLITQALNKQFPSFFIENIGQNDINGNILFNYLQSNAAKVMNSNMFDYFINSMTTDWSTDAQLNSV